MGDQKMQFMPWNVMDNINFNIKLVTKKNYKEVHLQNLCTFDIECSNGFLIAGVVRGYSNKKALKHKDMYKRAKHYSLMYHWQFSIMSTEGKIYAFHGRTWGEFERFIEELSKRIHFATVSNEKYSDDLYEALKHSSKNKIIRALGYIHNEGYEFQHLRNIWEDEFIKHKGDRGAVFAREERSPMKFTVKVGKVNWEWRDSYVLTGMSLKSWTKDLKVSKKSEPEWFYTPIRTPETPLDDEMLEYCLNDVVCMQYGLMEYKKDYDDVFDIPLTQTGIVRRQAIAAITKNKEWSKKCKEITMSTTWDEYKDLLDLFAGGWTHANCTTTGKTLKDVQCYDFASSYPACLTTRTFPIDKFVEVDPSEYDFLLSLDLEDVQLPYHYWLEFEAYNIDSKTCNTWWSNSKCVEIRGGQYDNGKIFAADYVRIKMTDLDFDTFRKAYEYDKDSFKIIRMYKAESGYLPVEFIQLILKWYGNKTSFKGIEEKIAEYNSSKRSVNGIYGCCVTKDITDIIDFVKGDPESGWKKKEMTEADYEPLLAEKDKQAHWTMYQIGVWTTAWARHNLWKCIFVTDPRCAYCDTDSCKGQFNDEDKHWILDVYNKEVLDLHQYVADYYGFDVSLYRPIDPKGIERPLGIFADDGYDFEFKTLGAKRYAVLTSDKKGNKVVETTIAGLPKKAGAKKLINLAKEYNKTHDDKKSPVDMFEDNIEWNSAESGKLVSYYCDNQDEAIWRDMYGNDYVSHDRYGICLMPTSFDMSMTPEYEALCDMIQHGISNTQYFENYTRIYAKHILKII